MDYCAETSSSSDLDFSGEEQKVLVISDFINYHGVVIIVNTSTQGRREELRDLTTAKHLS